MRPPHDLIDSLKWSHLHISKELKLTEREWPEFSNRAWVNKLTSLLMEVTFIYKFAIERTQNDPGEIPQVALTIYPHPNKLSDPVGYFIINEPHGGGLRLDTLSYSRREAIAKWLTHHGFTNAHLAIFDDETLERVWRQTRNPNTYCVIVEDILLVQGSAGNVTDGRKA